MALPMLIRSTRLAALLTPTLLAACGGDDDAGGDPGTLQIRIHGEAFAEDGIGADVFADGWAITFDAVLISVGEASAAAGDAEPALVESGYQIYDLTEPSDGAGFVIAGGEVAGGAYDDIAYRIAPAADATAGNAADDDVARLIAVGEALRIEGAATRGAVTKTFAWGFSGSTRYGHCAGTAVVDGDDAEAPAITRPTIHLDHLFYDDLFSSTPNVAFDLVAQADDDGDADGEVTADELAALDLSTQERYQVGSTGVADLWSFIEYQVATVGHIDGEGHCAEAVRE